MFLSSVCSFAKTKKIKQTNKTTTTTTTKQKQLKQPTKNHSNKLKPPNSFNWLQICNKTMRDKYHQSSISIILLLFSTHKSKSKKPKI